MIKNNGAPQDLPPAWAEALLQMQRTTHELVARMDRRAEEDRKRAEEDRKRYDDYAKRYEDYAKRAEDYAKRYEGYANRAEAYFKRAEEDRIWFKEFMQEMRFENRRREKEFARVLVTVGKVGGRILNTLDRMEGKLDVIARAVQRRDNGSNGQSRKRRKA